jgi:hypothetical protein
MSNVAIEPQAQAINHIQKAESYKKLGLNAQVQHELWEAQRLDPMVVGDPRYQALLSGAVAAVERVQSLRTPQRVGAIMLIVNTGIGLLTLLLVVVGGETQSIDRGMLIGPIVSLVIGINLWRARPKWQQYTVIWAILGLVVGGVSALLNGSVLDLLMQLAFSGSLLLLLVGTASRGRMIASVVLYALGYVGLFFVLVALAVLYGLAGGA